MEKCFVHNNVSSTWISDKADIHINVCKDLPLLPFAGEYYCILHLPDDEKHNITDFDNIFHQRIYDQNTDFRFVYFPNSINLFQNRFTKVVDFSYATFTQDAYFMLCKFSQHAYFLGASFLKVAEFRNSKFSENANFNYALFEQGAFFSGVAFDKNGFFKEAIFNQSVFFTLTDISSESQISFNKSTFKGAVRLDSAKIKGSIVFEGGKRENKEGQNEVEKVTNCFEGANSWLDLQNASIEKPERVYFHTVRLQPNWFINVDSKKFVFTNCRWKNNSEENVNTRSELRNLANRNIPSSNQLLTKACSQLADNYEEIKSFSEASLFRQISNESKRLEESNWKQPFTLHWWYWLSSFYGESWIRALFVLSLLIFLVFPICYALTDFQVCPSRKPLTISLNEDKDNIVCQIKIENCNCQERGLKIVNGEAFIHSLTTATLQNVDFRKPISFWSETWIILEKIFVPLQTALLALAIRRKFMR